MIDTVKKENQGFIPKQISADQAKDTCMAMVLICLLIVLIGHKQQFLGVAVVVLLINMIKPTLINVLSKARARWGVEVFKGLFERIVGQCVKTGLVNGKKLFVDASLIDANASNNSVIKKGSLKRYLHKGYCKLEDICQELNI